MSSRDPAALEAVRAEAGAHWALLKSVGGATSSPRYGSV